MKLGTRLLKVFLLIGMFLLGSGVVFSQEPFGSRETAGQSKPLTPTEPVPTIGVIGGSSSYKLGINDIVEVTVREQPEFSGQYVIGPDGNIQYAFVGDIQADGLTKDELKSAITEKLKKYIKVPEVSVTIVAYRSKFFYILGEVGRPGKYPLVGDSITLRDALVSAGLPTRSAALRRVYVIKPDETKPVYKKIDIYELLYKGNLKNNVVITNGDLIVVPSTVPSEINRALSNLLSPISRSAAVEAYFSNRR